MNKYRVLIETVAITAITMLGMLLIPPAKTLFALFPVAYLLVERRLRQRTFRPVYPICTCGRSASRQTFCRRATERE